MTNKGSWHLISSALLWGHHERQWYQVAALDWSWESLQEDFLLLDSPGKHQRTSKWQSLGTTSSAMKCLCEILLIKVFPHHTPQQIKNSRAQTLLCNPRHKQTVKAELSDRSICPEYSPVVFGYNWHWHCNFHSYSASCSIYEAVIPSWHLGHLL